MQILMFNRLRINRRLVRLLDSLNLQTLLRLNKTRFSILNRNRVQGRIMTLRRRTSFNARLTPNLLTIVHSLLTLRPSFATLGNLRAIRTAGRYKLTKA